MWRMGKIFLSAQSLLTLKRLGKLRCCLGVALLGSYFSSHSRVKKWKDECLFLQLWKPIYSAKTPTICSAPSRLNSSICDFEKFPKKLFFVNAIRRHAFCATIHMRMYMRLNSTLPILFLALSGFFKVNASRWFWTIIQRIPSAFNEHWFKRAKNQNEQRTRLVARVRHVSNLSTVFYGHEWRWYWRY